MTVGKKYQMILMFLTYPIFGCYECHFRPWCRRSAKKLLNFQLIYQNKSCSECQPSDRQTKDRRQLGSQLGKKADQLTDSRTVWQTKRLAERKRVRQSDRNKQAINDKTNLTLRRQPQWGRAQSSLCQICHKEFVSCFPGRPVAGIVEE